MAWAVSATIGIRTPPSSAARMRWAASKPSISGIWESIKIKS